MSISNADREMHDNYSEHMTEPHRTAVDDAYAAARDLLTERGIKCANDDRAEALIAAIARYIIQSDDFIAERIAARREAENRREERLQYAATGAE